MLTLILTTYPMFSVLFLTMLDGKNSKLFSMFASLVCLAMALTLFNLFNQSMVDFQSCYIVDLWGHMPHYSVLKFGIDSLSLFFILLSFFLIPMCLLISYESVNANIKLFCSFFLCLASLLCVVFTSLNLLTFFIAFEASMPMMFLLIGIWGSSLEKISASYYFLLYTLIASAPMLVSMVWLGSLNFSLDYETLQYLIPSQDHKLVWWGFFLCFAAKVPLMPLHLWLPLAHAEASVAGSVLLAGVLLKLGCYGFLSFLLAIFPHESQYFAPAMIVVSLVNIIYGGMCTVSQTDFKSLVAYSSISHLGMVVMGMFSYGVPSIKGSLVLTFAHGFSSPGLFILVTVLYDSFSTRTISYFRGLSLVMPIFSTLLLVFVLGNMGFPLTMNFLGEILILLGVFQDNPISCAWALSGMVLSAVYSLFFLNSVIFGKLSPYLSSSFSSRDISSLEFYSLMPLLITMLILGISTYPYSNVLYLCCQSIVG